MLKYLQQDIPDKLVVWLHGLHIDARVSLCSNEPSWYKMFPVSAERPKFAETENWGQILILLLTASVTLRKVLKFSELHFPYLKKCV